MAKYDWNEITAKDVLNAIHIFNEEKPVHPSARNTFLVYDGQKYPAKHIRGMAYKVHFGREISKADYSGGNETALFFSKLGFEVQYTHRYVNTHPIIHHNFEPKTIDSSKKGLKIGLYLQDNSYVNKNKSKNFQKAMECVSKSEIDILVFPEYSYVPFQDEIYKSDFLHKKDLQHLYDKAHELSNNIGKAIVICGENCYGKIISIYANAFANDTETKNSSYLKHTMTASSPLEMHSYPEYAKSAFQPILLKGYRIGLTICYDCNHPFFSRKYGLNNIDIIINSTGGNVVYDKWYKYNKARAIENNCFTFVTMGASQNKNNSHSYVYGFTPKGKEMIPLILNKKDNEKHSVPEGIYIYNTEDYDGSSEVERSINQKESINKNIDIMIPTLDISSFLSKAQMISKDIHLLNYKGFNIIICTVKDMDIMKPEKVLRLLYAKELKSIPNKRFIILNTWDVLDETFYNTQLSLILKVRAMENYCAVLLNTPSRHLCFQCGLNRTAQVVMKEKGKFGIDLSRASGPDTIWKDKDGMKGEWRKNIEWLIESMQ